MKSGTVPNTTSRTLGGRSSRGKKIFLAAAILLSNEEDTLDRLLRYVFS